MSNKREEAYNATHGRCAYCGCLISPEDFFLNQLHPGQFVAACPDCAKFKGPDDVELFRSRLEVLSVRSIKARLALKYNPESSHATDADYHRHHHGKICFYFEELASGKNSE